MAPPVWLAWARKEYPQQRNERPTPYIRRLHGLMQNGRQRDGGLDVRNLPGPLLRSSQSRPTSCTKSAQVSDALFKLLRFYACTILYNCTFDPYIFPPASSAA